jgi:hypothetical protein
MPGLPSSAARIPALGVTTHVGTCYFPRAYLFTGKTIQLNIHLGRDAFDQSPGQQT